MNSGRRSFISGTAVLLAGTMLSPLAAVAGTGNGITALISASFSHGPDGKRKKFQDRLEIGRKQAGKLQELTGQKRASYLSGLILRWLKKRFPDAPWPKIGRDVGKELARQTLAQLKRSGMDNGEKPIPSKINIKIKFKFNPPNEWEIGIEISF